MTTPEEQAELRHRIATLEDLLMIGKDTSGAITQATSQCITDLDTRLKALETAMAQVQDAVFAIKDEVFDIKKDLEPLDNGNPIPLDTMADMNKIVKYAAIAGGVSIKAIRARNRNPAITPARHAAAIVARRRGHLIRVIAKGLNKDECISTYVKDLERRGALHPTTIAIVKSIEELMANDEAKPTDQPAPDLMRNMLRTR